MSDEKPVPETLESIAASIRDMRLSVGSQFADVRSQLDDLRTSMDSRFDDVKAQLRTEIESVRGDVRIVAEAVAAQTVILQRHERTHETFTKRFDSHDTRILVLERKNRDGSSA